MGPILQFIRPFDLFDRATWAVLSEAYDRALISLNEAGRPMLLREALAAGMLDLAALGERDVGRLSAAALASIGDL
jgi:hypothetical protein